MAGPSNVDIFYTSCYLLLPTTVDIWRAKPVLSYNIVAIAPSSSRRNLQGHHFCYCLYLIATNTSKTVRTTPSRPLGSMAPSSKQRKIAIVGSRSVGPCLPPLLSRSTQRLTSSTTGKSSLAVQFVENHFVDSYYPTIENTFSKDIRYKGTDYATEIVDTAGQVRPVAMSPPGPWWQR